MITGTHASIGPFCTPSTLANQPSWKTSDGDAERGADREQVHDRGLDRDHERAEHHEQQQRGEQDHDQPKNSGSLLASTCEKSIEPAVNPPTSTVMPVWRSSAGSTVSRRWLTRLVVATACGAEFG